MPNSFGRPAWYSLLALTAAACEPQQGADAGNPGTSARTVSAPLDWICITPIESVWPLTT